MPLTQERIHPADTLISYFSVEEMLMYTAELKTPISNTHADRKRIVEGCIQQLGLEKCRGVHIGRQESVGLYLTSCSL